MRERALRLTWKRHLHLCTGFACPYARSKWAYRMWVVLPFLKSCRCAHLLDLEPSDSEAHGNLQPISPHELSVSPDGHVLCTLDTASRAGPGGGGRDLLAWGNNYERQLGNGKRSSIAVPENVHVTPGGPRYVLRSTKAKEVRDLSGRVWGRGVKVEQVALAGVGNSVVYWKLL